MKFKAGDKVQWKHSIADRLYGGRVSDTIFTVLAVLDNDRIRINTVSARGSSITQDEDLFKFARA